MEFLSLETASLIVDKAIEKGRELGLEPLTVAVLDAGGQLKALKREDRSSLLRPEIAIGKAWGVLGMGHGGRELARRAANVPVLFNTLSVMSGGRMVPFPGGVLIRSATSEVLGAVGVSGDAPDNDEACAVYGVKTANLLADTGEAG